MIREQEARRFAVVLRETINRGEPEHHRLCVSGKDDERCDCYGRRRAPARAALDSLLAALARVEQERDEARCEFGCGPRPDDGSQVGGPGFGVVPACPVHGWICVLLDRAEAGRDAAEARAARAEKAISYVLDQAIAAWHDAPSVDGKPDPLLFEWLGLNRDEYAAYVECRWDDLIASIAARAVLAAVDEPPPSELGGGGAAAKGSAAGLPSSLSGEPVKPDWVRCNRCGHAWDENDPDSLVCPCLDKHGYRTVTQLPGDPLSKAPK